MASRFPKTWGIDPVIWNFAVFAGWNPPSSDITYSEAIRRSVNGAGVSDAEAAARLAAILDSEIEEFFRRKFGLAKKQKHKGKPPIDGHSDNDS